MNTCWLLVIVILTNHCPGKSCLTEFKNIIITFGMKKVIRSGDCNDEKENGHDYVKTYKIWKKCHVCSRRKKWPWVTMFKCKTCKIIVHRRCCQRLHEPDNRQTLSDREEAGCSRDDGNETTVDAEPVVHVPEHSSQQLVLITQPIVIQQFISDIQPVAVHVTEAALQQFAREVQLMLDDDNDHDDVHTRSVESTPWPSRQLMTCAAWTISTDTVPCPWPVSCQEDAGQPETVLCEHDGECTMRPDDNEDDDVEDDKDDVVHTRSIELIPWPPRQLTTCAARSISTDSVPCSWPGDYQEGARQPECTMRPDDVLEVNVEDVSDDVVADDVLPRSVGPAPWPPRHLTPCAAWPVSTVTVSCPWPGGRQDGRYVASAAANATSPPSDGSSLTVVVVLRRPEDPDGVLARVAGPRDAVVVGSATRGHTADAAAASVYAVDVPSNQCPRPGAFVILDARAADGTRVATIWRRRRWHRREVLTAVFGLRRRRLPDHRGDDGNAVPAVLRCAHRTRVSASGTVVELVIGGGLGDVVWSAYLKSHGCYFS